jgi:ubiquinone/menaquinone biosynthesis C-methylase UbiE
MSKEKSEEFYEQKYKSESEPWEYSKKAVEVLRHDFILRTALFLKSGYTRILDVGCSKGQLTSLFRGMSPEIYGIDVSETALVFAKKSFDEAENKPGDTCQYFFKKENITSLSFPENSFDLVLLCDGIFEWFMINENRIQALKETHRVLMKKGFVILSDYGNQKYFDEYLALVKASGLEVFATYRCNDRLCYQFNSWLKAVEKSIIARKLIESKLIARFLIKVSSLFGAKGSKHIFVVATKI